MSFREKSFWLDEEYKPNEPVTSNREVDVAIIGGGFTGLSAAYFLKKEDPTLKIALLEKEVIGYGASGRNGGFCMTLLAENAMDLVEFAGGLEAARLAHKYQRAAVDHVDSMVKDYGLKCDYEKKGLMTMALNPAHIEKIKEYVETYNKLGSDAVFLDQDEVRRRFHTEAFYAACYDKHCAILNPAKLCREMKRVVEGMGVDVYEMTEVLGYEEGEKIRVRTANGSVTAKAMVLGTNAYIIQLDRRFRESGVTVFTYIVLTEPMTDKQYESIGWQGREGIETSLRMINYFRLTADNRIAMGGGDALYFYNDNLDHDRDDYAFQVAHRDLLKFFPQLEGIEITHQWGGPVFMNPDWIPSFGRTGRHNNILFSLGYSGHGVAGANYSGVLIRNLYFEKKSEWDGLFFQNYRTKYWMERGMRNTLVRKVAFDLIKGYYMRQDRAASKSLAAKADRDYYRAKRFQKAKE
jgi:glycine/D-amino acid oxidase-like deaminating enzyme